MVLIIGMPLMESTPQPKDKLQNVS